MSNENTCLTKFRADTIRKKIARVQVLRETEQSVFLPPRYGSKDRREAKESSYYIYCDTWAQAKDWLVTHYERGAEVARRRLDIANDELAKVRALQEG